MIFYVIVGVLSLMEVHTQGLFRVFVYLVEVWPIHRLSNGRNIAVHETLVEKQKEPKGSHEPAILFLYNPDAPFLVAQIDVFPKVLLSYICHSDVLSFAGGLCNV